MGERNRLGREIHDGIAQQLAFLKMQVGWLRRTPERVDAPQLERIEKGLEMALIEARHAIATLRAEPSDASTGEMIAAYLEEFGQVSGLNVEIDRSDGLPEVAATARVELLRIVQEALNNVRKHALADNVRVSICPDTSGVRIDIRDNGSGFETGQDLEGHFGLSIMRERAESVGGTLEIESAVGEGTCLHVWIPASDTTSGFAQRLLGR